MHTIYDIICNDSEKTFNHKEHATTNTNSEYESLLTPTEHFFEYEIIIKCFQLFNTKTIYSKKIGKFVFIKKKM